MNALRDLTVFSKLMLGLCLFLGAIIIAEATILNLDRLRAAGDLSEQPKPTSSTEVAAAEPMVIPPIITYREIAERPLFSDTRRPQEAVVADKDATPAGQLGSAWKLTGIVVSGESSSVHLSGIRDSRTERLQTGMMLDGWRLESISRDKAVFSSAGRTAVLRLHEEEEESRVTPIKRR